MAAGQRELGRLGGGVDLESGDGGAHRQRSAARRPRCRRSRGYGRSAGPSGGDVPLDHPYREAPGRLTWPRRQLRHIGPARAERLVDEHGEGVLSAIAADPLRVFGSLRGVSESQAAAAADSWHAEPRRPRPPRPARAARAGPPGGADPRPLRRALDDDPARGPLPADGGRGGRLRPRRQDRAGRRRAARVQPPRPGRRRLRPRRGRAAGQQLPAAGRADPAHRRA